MLNDFKRDGNVMINETEAPVEAGLHLNQLARAELKSVLNNRGATSLGVRRSQLSSGASIFDFGVDSQGSLQAGILLARLCMAGLTDVSLTPSLIDGIGFPTVQVQTDHPVEACLLSQYAGCRVSVAARRVRGISVAPLSS